VSSLLISSSEAAEDAAIPVSEVSDAIRQDVSPAQHPIAVRRFVAPRLARARREVELPITRSLRAIYAGITGIELMREIGIAELIEAAG
jgi:hypothetical protein